MVLHRVLVTASAMLFWIGVLAPSVGAQGVTQRGRPAEASGPRFIAERVPGAPPSAATDVRNAPVFSRRIALNIDNASVADAVAAIARAGHVQIGFSSNALAAAAPVSLSSRGTTVGAALAAVLYDTGVDVVLAADREHVTLVPRSPTGAVPPTSSATTGVVTGDVRDAVTRQPLQGVTVMLVGTKLSTYTGYDGKYVLRQVPLGHQYLRYQRLGYVPGMTELEVTGDSALRYSLVMVSSPRVLDEIVTTASGDESRLAVGHDITTINVDSVLRTAPITSITDVLNGRVPGLEVLPASGEVGTAPRIRIRGVASLSLTNDPIVIVDGVRFDNQEQGQAGGGRTVSRLDDLMPDDVASIEVVKGPSATTLYGTDAANGVIVVKTKRGSDGSTRWDFGGMFGPTQAAGSRSQFPDDYYAWGHTTDGNNTPVQCLLLDMGFGPLSFPGGIAGQNDHSCVVDSVTHFSSLNSPSLSVLGTGQQQQYEGSVRGGTARMQYYISGILDNQTGGLRLPPAEVQQLLQQTGSVPGNVLHPNISDHQSLNGTFTLQLSPQLQVAVATTLGQNDARTIDESTLLQGLLQGPGYKTTTFTNPQIGLFAMTPASLFSNVNETKGKRVLESVHTDWTPADWLSTRVTVGADYSNLNSTAVQPAQPTGPTAASGSYSQYLTTNAGYSADLGATARAPLTHWLTASTSIGVQYQRRIVQTTAARGFQLALGSPNLDGATSVYAYQYDYTAATLGGYVQEKLGIDDRLWVTGAVRWDGGSGFGALYNFATYPKADISWLAYQRGQNTLRLRAAFGYSGNQAPVDARVRVYEVQSGLANGQPTTGAALAGVGNAILQPERSHELETGFDFTAFDGAIALSVTPYWKTTTNELLGVPLPASLGPGSRLVNLGEVTNKGIEGNLTLIPISRQSFEWDVTISGSYNVNDIVRLTPTFDSLASGNAGTARYVVGYPLAGVWAHKVTYKDLNGDRIIEPNEITIDSSMRYYGPSTPPTQVTVATGIGLFHGTVKVRALFNYQGGNAIYNATTYEACGGNYFFNFSSRGCNDINAPLALKAADAAAGVYGPSINGGEPPLSPFIAKGAVWRFQELGVSYVIPHGVLRTVRLSAIRDLNVSLTVRDLFTWTSYPGIDPSVGAYNATGDAPYDAGVLPQPRTWLVRIHAGF